MNRSTQFIFRLKCIIKKCRENGLFTIAIKLKEKYNSRDKKKIKSEGILKRGRTSWAMDVNFRFPR